jgi:hypothetical protein
MIQSKYKINIEGLEDYRVTESGELWKLEVTDSIGRFLKPRRIKKDEDRDAYRIGDKYFTARNIQANLIEDDTVILNDEQERFLK